MPKTKIRCDGQRPVCSTCSALIALHMARTLHQEELNAFRWRGMKFLEGYAQCTRFCVQSIRVRGVRYPGHHRHPTPQSIWPTSLFKTATTL
ncbi:hypothetical protein BDZ45DRAFT_676275 [Acephala macrosclerotiorum]|nr:hypothetical protein BDZ45DRAFT_676275 [Acephala macrosclerotiorum]